MKEKKVRNKIYFNHQYIPIIIGCVIFVALAGLLVYFVVSDTRSEVLDVVKKTTTTTKAQDELFEHKEILVDTSDSKCDASKMAKYKEEAKNIDIKYRLQTDVIDDKFIDYDTGEERDEKITGKFIYMDIINTTKNLKFEFKSDFDREITSVNGKKAKKGVLSVKKNPTTKNVKYVVTVYTNDKCYKKPIRKFRINPPIYNYHADTLNCTKTEFEDDGLLIGSKYCEELIYGEQYTDIEIIEAKMEALDELEKSKEKTEVKTTKKASVINKIKNTIKNDNKVLILAIIALIVLIFVIILFVQRVNSNAKKKNK